MHSWTMFVKVHKYKQIAQTLRQINQVRAANDCSVQIAVETSEKQGFDIKVSLKGPTNLISDYCQRQIQDLPNVQRAELQDEGEFTE